MKARVLHVALRTAGKVWDVVWKTMVIVALIVSLATGGIQLAEKQGVLEGNPLKAIVELPEDFAEWLKVTGAAAEKYCAEGGCPSSE